MTTVGRFHGPIADELYVLCRLDGTAARAGRAYEALLEALASEGAGPQDLVSETCWLRSAATDLEQCRSERARVLGDRGYRPATAFVEQPPLNGASVEIAATAVIPHRRAESSVDDVTLEAKCPCAACSQGLGAKVLRIGDHQVLHAGDIAGVGSGAYEEARDMFRMAEEVLSNAGFGFGDVVRTWIYLRDIDRDYDALNRARRDFFEHGGIDLRPASTGVQGGPASPAHDFSMSVCAMRSPALQVSRLSTPLLSEAWTYGADFSRGLRVADANKSALYISGTASIDEAGRTVHLGDFTAQVHRMIDNIGSLLEANGAAPGDLVSGVVYLPAQKDAAELRSIMASRGFGEVPWAMVEAPLCRPDLLCEAEALAVLPLPAAAA